MQASRWWLPSVTMWCEGLTNRAVNGLELLASLKQVGPLVLMRCAELDVRPSDLEILRLAELTRRFGGWLGIKSLRSMEEGRGTSNALRRIECRAAKELENLFSFSAVMDQHCCVRILKIKEQERTFYAVDLLLFTIGRAHMDLYIAAEALQGCDSVEYGISIFRPMTVVLDVEHAPDRTCAVLALFDGQCALEKITAPSTWLGLTQIMWPGAECISVEQWKNESSESEVSVEKIIQALTNGGFGSSVEGYPVYPPVVIVQRNLKGQHAKCLVVGVSQRRRFGGAVLFASYLGYETRLEN